MPARRKFDEEQVPARCASTRTACVITARASRVRAGTWVSAGDRAGDVAELEISSAGGVGRDGQWSRVGRVTVREPTDRGGQHEQGAERDRATELSDGVQHRRRP